jgi:hypothetical protein
VCQLYIITCAAATTTDRASNLELMAMTYSAGTGCYGKAWIKCVYLVYSALDLTSSLLERARQAQTRIISTGTMTRRLATPDGSFDTIGALHLR